MAHPFSEREFYLAEFRGRTIGFAWPPEESPGASALSPGLSGLIEELVENGTRVVLMSPRDDVLAVAGAAARIEAATTEAESLFDPNSWAPALWQCLRRSGCAGLHLPESDFEASCQRAAVALRLAKVVWIQSSPPVYRGEEQEEGGSASRVSVVDLAHLDRLLGGDAVPGEFGLSVRPGREKMLQGIRSMIQGGVPSVNVCAPEDAAKELLTYAGAGIFFTRDRYAEVRKLALDDYDQASDLIGRGEADGFLLPRDSVSRDRVLAHGIGLFIEGRYLAGIGAVLPYPEASAVEIVSLYALTRYAGEGVGSQIVRFAVERARIEGFEYAFSCTTSKRVSEFFEKSGFSVVPSECLPPNKWDDYDEERFSRVICLRASCRGEP